MVKTLKLDLEDSMKVGFFYLFICNFQFAINHIAILITLTNQNLYTKSLEKNYIKFQQKKIKQYATITDLELLISFADLFIGF